MPKPEKDIDVLELKPSDVVVIPERQITPLTMLNKIIDKGGDIETMKAFMDLQERNDRNEARKAFHVAMSNFKANPPKIIKDSQVSYLKTKYNHATLGNVTSAINESLSKHGLSTTWKTGQEKGVTVTCCITHALGHQECTSLTAPADSSGSKNAIQAIGSTVTYLQRYTLLALTGLATHEQDDDGQGYQKHEPVRLMTNEQARAIKDKCEKEGISPEDFANEFGISRSESTEADAARFIKTIDNKIKQFIGAPK